MLCLATRASDFELGSWAGWWRWWARAFVWIVPWIVHLCYLFCCGNFPPHPMGLGMERRASCMRGKCPTPELRSWLCCGNIFIIWCFAWKSAYDPQYFLPLSHSCTYWCWNKWTRRNASRHVQWLFLCSVQISAEVAAGARPVVIHKDVQVPSIFLLQKLCIYFGSFLVLVLQWLLGTGKITFFN